MSIRSTPLPLLLALLFAFGTLISCGGGGSSQYDDECEDYTEGILGCLELDFDSGDAENLTKDRCIDDLEESEDIDGDDCVEAQLAVYACITPVNVTIDNPPVGAAEEQECIDLFSFLQLRWSDLFFLSPPVLRGTPTPPLDFCDTEIRAAFDLCPQSIALPGDPNNPV